MTVAPSVAPGVAPSTSEPDSTAASDTRRANQLLDDLKRKYRYLDDVTVTVGSTPSGEQAIAYYTEGKIIISRTHTVSLEKILNHEVWHVIDWRDNGRLDWHEDIPPSNPSPYLSGSL